MHVGGFGSFEGRIRGIACARDSSLSDLYCNFELAGGNIDIWAAAWDLVFCTFGKTGRRSTASFQQNNRLAVHRLHRHSLMS
jgi:hypothetical protein